MNNNYLNFAGARVLWPPDCPDNMLQFAVERAITLRKEFPVDSQGVKLAEELKKSMDKKYDPYWHVVCGKNFGCYAIHQSRNFIFFYLDTYAFLMYKAG
jgi:dynein light chain LC8-type